MLDIRQSEAHMTNNELYKLVNTRPINAIIRERQLQFIGHCLRMPSDEPANIYALYASNKAVKNRRGPGRQTNLNPEQSLRFTADEIAMYAKDKSAWKKLVAAPKKPDR